MSARHESWPSQMEALESQIRAIHRLVGNVQDIDRYHIVLAAGSSPLIPAAMSAIADHRTVEITAENPYYTGYPGAIRSMENSKYIWAPTPTYTRPVREV